MSKEDLVNGLHIIMLTDIYQMYRCLLKKYVLYRYSRLFEHEPKP